MDRNRLVQEITARLKKSSNRSGSGLATAFLNLIQEELKEMVRLQFTYKLISQVINERYGVVISRHTISRYIRTHFKDVT